ncbi:PREDICTED: uncharacterized protein LOC104808342 [Tarenaya hassleriana]|uniref:uncharacterized protein LOC104808342 n=1 Tax=Tarenaya hassleriana TaxID=28532 RepID=UPI00053C165D|nr:PREDICTED: uncharacterized protein LOC104808342 [Tarenaya hassleriana]
MSSTIPTRTRTIWVEKFHPNLSYKSDNVENFAPNNFRASNNSNTRIPPNFSFQSRGPNQNSNYRTQGQSYINVAPLGNQIAQLALAIQRPSGSLPDSSETNPREHVNAITLRSVYVPPPRSPPVPFPSHLRKHNEDSQFAKFVAMPKKLEVTVPFTAAILQIPSYTKYLKDILTKKRVIEKETMALIVECSALIQHELPLKRSDPGSFSIPCKLGNISIDRALFDLGTDVNLLPLSIFKKLNVGELKPTRMILQLANRSVKYPVGIFEDVPLKVRNFYIPVDFVVLDMDEHSKIPIILGRPFLNTADAIIHV